MKRIETKKIVYSFLVIGVFIFAFVLLIKKQDPVLLADKIENNFNYHTVYGKQLVVRDFNYNYPKYYVIYFIPDGTFDIHAFSLYENEANYQNDYNLMINNIIDYNSKDLMLRVLYTRGVGTYDSVMDDLGSIINSNNWRVFE